MLGASEVSVIMEIAIANRSFLMRTHEGGCGVKTFDGGVESFFLTGWKVSKLYRDESTLRPTKTSPLLGLRSIIGWRYLRALAPGRLCLLSTRSTIA